MPVPIQHDLLSTPWQDSSSNSVAVSSSIRLFGNTQISMLQLIILLQRQTPCKQVIPSKDSRELLSRAAEFLRQSSYWCRNFTTHTSSRIKIAVSAVLIHSKYEFCLRNLAVNEVLPVKGYIYSPRMRELE